MNKIDILSLLVLGRDRIYIELEQVQKAIKLSQNEGLSDVVEMLIYKEEEIKIKKEKATKIIEEYKKRGGK